MASNLGPLAGVRVVEFAGVGPCPFAGMLLRQMGAEVLRIDRSGVREGALPIPADFDYLNEGKARLLLDLKSPEGRAKALEIVAVADAMIEGFRPGVMERLGLGPDECLARNPRLVYGRVTGWGREGPLAMEAGHDINYIAITGALAMIGPKDGAPVPPINLVGDFAGGALYLSLGVLAALLGAKTSGRGQVVDAAMVDGAAHLMTFLYGLHNGGMWNLQRGSNSSDGGAPFYGVYETADKRWLAVAATEMKFRMAFINALGLEENIADAARKPALWKDARQKIAAVIATRTRDDWCARLAGHDACVAPVLTMEEAPHHPHARERKMFVKTECGLRPAPAPRFSNGAASSPERDAATLLADWGLSK